MTSTLTELERKLVDLERELGTVTAGGPVAPVTVREPPTPAETQTAALRVDDLRGEIADLVRFRDQLEAAARELVTEYDRLVARLRTPGGETPAAVGPPPAAPPPAPVAPPPPAVPEQELPPAVAAGMRGPGGRPAADPGRTYAGAVTVDAGPFTDIATLQAFEQALGRVEGAGDVYVKSFEGNRALIDVRLSNPVHLVQQLRDQCSLPIMVREAGESRLTVDVAQADPDGT